MKTDLQNFVIEYEDLEGKNAMELATMVEQVGFTIPYVDMAWPIVARVDGEIVGWSFAQLLPHCGPSWVKPEFRGSGIYEELARRTAEKIVDKSGKEKYIAVAGNRFAEILCEKAGMKRVEGVVYVKE